MNKPTITAIIPAYNEASSIVSVIKNLKPLVNEIIVVDNGSKDATYKVAKEAGAKVHRENRKVNGIGYGYAHITGMKHATSDYIITVDADGEHPITKISAIINFAQKNNYDFVLCSRKQTQSQSIQTKIRRFGIWLFTQAVRILYGYKVQDLLSGMWVIRRDRVPLLNLSEGGWNLSPEIKLAAITNPEFKVGEYFINASVRKYGESKQILWKTGLQHLAFVLSYRIKTLRVSVGATLPKLMRFFTLRIF